VPNDIPSKLEEPSATRGRRNNSKRKTRIEEKNIAVKRGERNGRTTLSLPRAMGQRDQGSLTRGTRVFLGDSRGVRIKKKPERFTQVTEHTSLVPAFAEKGLLFPPGLTGHTEEDKCSDLKIGEKSEDAQHNGNF